RSYSHFGPFAAEFTSVWQHNEPIEIPLEPVTPGFAPTSLDRPAVQFSQCHERNHHYLAGQICIMECRERMIFKEVGNDVRIDDDNVHATRPVLLWPRHSSRAAKKSSTGSSSGQKSP